MDLGLYNLKYPLRRALEGLLPALKHTDPNTITWTILPVGIATAWFASRGLDGVRWAWLVCIALVLLRMFLATLDGLVAQNLGRETKTGTLLNRFVPELCDVLLMFTFVGAGQGMAPWAVVALAVGWLTTFAGIVGPAAGLPAQSVGPVGQTDRLAAFMVAALVSAFEPAAGWSWPPMRVFLMWCVFGGAVTVMLRMTRHFTAARKTP